MASCPRVLLLSGGVCAFAALAGLSFFALRHGEAPPKNDPVTAKQNSALETAVTRGTVDLPTLGTPKLGEVSSAPGIALAQRMAFITGTSLTINLDDETTLAVLGGRGNHLRVRRQGHSLVYLSPDLPAAAMGANTIELEGGANTLDFAPMNKTGCTKDLRIAKDLVVIGFKPGLDHIRLPCSANGRDIRLAPAPATVDPGQNGGENLVFLAGTAKGDTEIYQGIEAGMLWHLATLAGVSPPSLGTADFR